MLPKIRLANLPKIQQQVCKLKAGASAVPYPAGPYKWRGGGHNIPLDGYGMSLNNFFSTS